MIQISVCNSTGFKDLGVVSLPCVPRIGEQIQFDILSVRKTVSATVTNVFYMPASSLKGERDEFYRIEIWTNIE